MRRVVVVEDDPFNATLFRAVLERRGGFQVTVSEDPAEVLQLCRGGGVALVILDVSLANSRWKGQSVSGVDLCRLLKQDPLAAAVPVMLATAHAMRGDGDKLMAESGADDYVSKPIVDHAAFMNQVRGLMKEAA